MICDIKHQFTRLEYLKDSSSRKTSSAMIQIHKTKQFKPKARSIDVPSSSRISIVLGLPPETLVPRESADNTGTGLISGLCINCSLCVDCCFDFLFCLNFFLGFTRVIPGSRHDNFCHFRVDPFVVFETHRHTYAVRCFSSKDRFTPVGSLVHITLSIEGDVGVETYLAAGQCPCPSKKR